MRASDYLKAHPTCEVCGMRPAVFVSFGAQKAYCRKCGETYIHQGHAVIEPFFRMDGEREDAEMENDVEDALRKLQEHEANAYLGNDRQDATVKEDESVAETVEDALQRLKTYEANAYLQEG